jgi:hypothetical protein
MNGTYAPKKRTATFSAETREKIGEIEDLLVADQVEYIRHRGIVAAARVVLVFPQRLHEVILALAGKAGHVLLTGIIPLVAEVATVLFDEGPGPLHALGIDRASNFRRRQFCEVSRDVAQIVIRESLHHLVHRLDHSQLLPKHDELNGKVEGRLTPEGGDLGNYRLPTRAVAGEACRKTRFNRISVGGRHRQQDERRSDYGTSYVTQLAYSTSSVESLRAFLLINETPFTPTVPPLRLPATGDGEGELFTPLWCGCATLGDS